MKTALLDLNMLTALLWPAHEHHAAAHVWFARHGNATWATCPLTQLGFVRLVTNPAFSRDALTPADALVLVARNISHANHQFGMRLRPHYLAMAATISSRRFPGEDLLLASTLGLRRRARDQTGVDDDHHPRFFRRSAL